MNTLTNRKRPAQRLAAGDTHDNKERKTEQEHSVISTSLSTTSATPLEKGIATKSASLSLEWREKLRINYKLIVEDARLGDLLDNFYSEGIFSEEEREIITQFDGVENEKNRKFLDILLVKDESCFKKFLSHLNHSGRADLADVILYTNVSKKRKVTFRFASSADWEEKILRNYKTIVLQSDLERLLDVLYSEEIFTEEEKDAVRTKGIKNDKNRLILRTLLKKTQGGFDLFLEYLKRNNMSEVADMLDETDTKETPIYTREIKDVEEIKLRRRVFRMRQQIIDVSNLDDFLDDFVTARVINMDDLDRLKYIASRREKNREILDIVFRKSYSCFKLLLELLRKNGELSEDIDNIIVDESAEKEIKDMYFLSKQTDVIPATKRDQANVQLSSWKEGPYVEVHSSQAALENARKSTIVTVTGNSGTGKTATTHYVALKLAEDGYDVLPVSNLKELMKLLHPGYKQAFVIDNPVGSQTLDEDELELWVKQNEILNNLRVQNTKILWSIRKEMLTDKLFRSVLGKNIIDLEDQANSLTIDEKLLILKSHLKNESYEISPEMNKMISRAQESFPLLCKMFASNDDFIQSNENFFKNPYALLRKDLDEMSREKYCVLVLCLCHAPLMAKDFIETDALRKKSSSYGVSFANILNACKLQQSIPVESLRDQLDSLTKVYLKKDGLFYNFSHVITRDVVACHFGNTKQIPFLTICQSEQIRDLVSVSESKGESNPNTIVIEQQNIPDLLLRLLSDIQKGKFNPAVLHDCWNDEFALRVFVDMLGDCRLVDNCFNSDVINIFCECTSTSGNKADNISVACKDQNVIESWSWHHTAMRCLALPGVTAMHWIAVFSRRRLFRIIWRNLSDVQKQQVVQKLPLIHFAFLGGDREICSSLVEREAEMVCIPLSPNSGVANLLPIHYAMMQQRQVEDLLLHLYPSENDMVSSDGYTPLFIAAAYGNKSAAERLIFGYSADVNECTENGWTPLMISVQNNHIDVIQLLLEQNAEVNQDDQNGWNPLHIAVQNNNIDAVHLLLDYEANIDQSDTDNRTPLLKAVQKGFLEITMLLLSHHASVRKRNINGNCPIHIVAQNNDIRIAKTLFEMTKGGEGLDLEAHNKYGNSPLQIAVKNDSNDVAELLVQYKAQVDNRDIRGRTPFLNAVSKGNIRLAEVLVNSGAGIDISSNNGNSPLHIAIQENNLQLTELLLRKGANINFPDNNWDSPLLKAIAYKHSESASLLISHSACVNQSNIDGETPLMCAAKYNLSEMVTLLVHKGANKKAKDVYGKMAYQFADSVQMVKSTAHDLDDVGVKMRIGAILEREEKRRKEEEACRKLAIERRLSVSRSLSGIPRRYRHISGYGTIMNENEVNYKLSSSDRGITPMKSVRFDDLD